jgi:hypothetical protein
MKTVIDFLKTLPDSTPFSNFVGEKIFNTKVYVKKSRLMVDYWLFEILCQNFKRPRKFEKSQKTKILYGSLMSKNVKIEPQLNKIWADFGFSSVNPWFGTKKSKRHESTQKNFWTKTKNTCPIILIESPNNEI